MKRTTIAGIALAAIALAGCTPEAAPDTEPISAEELAALEAPTESADTGAEIGTAEPTPAPAPKPEPAPAPIAEPEPEPEPSIEEEIVDEISDRDLALVAMEIAWSDVPAADRDDMCWAWELTPNVMIESFMGGAGEMGEYITVSDVRGFFDGKCL